MIGLERAGFRGYRQAYYSRHTLLKHYVAIAMLPQTLFDFPLKRVKKLFPFLPSD